MLNVTDLGLEPDDKPPPAWISRSVPPRIGASRGWNLYIPAKIENAIKSGQNPGLGFSG